MNGRFEKIDKVIGYVAYSLLILMAVACGVVFLIFVVKCGIEIWNA